jgi:hypothetical protein
MRAFKQPMRRLAAGLAAGLALASLAVGADARQAVTKRYYIASVNDNSMAIIDWQTVRGDSAGHAFATLVFVNKEIGDDGAAFLTADVEFDCAGHWRTQAVTAEDKDFVQISSLGHDGDWLVAGPDSVAARFAEAACKPGQADASNLMTATAPEMRRRFVSGEIET